VKDNEIKELLKQDRSEPKESRQTWSQVYSEISKEPGEGLLRRLRFYILPALASFVLVVFFFIEKREGQNVSELSPQESEAIAEYLFENVGFAEEEEFTLSDETSS
jgi:hypothetical protein